MTLYILPAGFSRLGLERPVIQAPLPLPPGMIAEDYDYRTPRDLKSVFDPADTIDAQVQYAMVVVRNSGAVATTGQRFKDITKLDDSAKVQIEREARTVLARLVKNRDIRIKKLVVEIFPPDSAEVQIDYVNLRARGNKNRSESFRVS